MKIVIASDHAGWEMKEDIKVFLKGLGEEVRDLGTESTAPVDYPDYTLAVARAVASREAERGIMICGTGIGSSIVANKVPGIRAALCHNVYTAERSRTHNDANVLCLGERAIGKDQAREIVKIWLTTPFSFAARHVRRLEKIKKIEGERQEEAKRE